MSPDELKQARHKLGLTCEKFAEVFGVASGRTVRGWETGERNGQRAPVPKTIELLVLIALEFSKVREWLGIHDQQKAPLK